MLDLIYDFKAIDFRNFFYHVRSIFKREFRSYFLSGTAFIYVTFFLLVSNGLAFYFGDIIATGQADLHIFFKYHIYIYVFFLPALAMRLWSEERQNGTMDTLLTLPISVYAVIWGKFFAAWAFLSMSLGATFPIWVTINILGDADNSVILCSYIGSFLTAGALLSICCYASIYTQKQVVAFILGMMGCFLFLILGFGIITEPLSHLFSDYLVIMITNFSILTHFENFIRGFFSFSAFLYLLSIMILSVHLTYWHIQYMRIKGH